MPENNKSGNFWSNLSKKEKWLSTIVSLLVAWQFLGPMLSNTVDTLQAIPTVVPRLEQLEQDIIRHDSIFHAEELQHRTGQEFKAVGLRSDKEGKLWYRDKYGDLYRVIPNYQVQRYMYIDKHGVTHWVHFDETTDEDPSEPLDYK